MNDNKQLEQLRHSAAHLLAHAISELYPDTLLTIGPATAEGFFYDCKPTHNFKESDLPAIQERMHEIAQRNLPIEHTQISKQRAREIYKDNPFKLELIDQIPGDTVGLATQGDFHDLCKGGHVASTGEIKHFKLLHVSGSYWRANRDGQVLQRITGTAFFTQADLLHYEERRENALKYDHRRLGKDLDLFSFHEEGPGFVFFHPKGKRVIDLMTSYLRNLLDKAGYVEISTPIMLSDELWKRSGHYAHYKNNMYFTEIEERSFAIKPMNCPGAILIYKERPRSYRELPLRLAEFGLVHRFELSGVLHGLFRVRAFTQDDGHIFCTYEQMDQEVLTAIDLTYQVLKRFKFNDIKVYVSTKPQDAMGADELWDTATHALKDGLTKAGVPFQVNEGEGAFYGPKIEFHIEDSMGRTWQCGTIQIDFFQPQNFDLSYINSQGTKSRPVMIHRAIYGSFERFFGILLEHTKGHLPFWIAPIQATILTITDDQKAYGEQLLATLTAHGVRAIMDTSSDPLAGKIKTAQLHYVPWMLIVGKKEVANNQVTLRRLDGSQEMGLSIEALISKSQQENAQ
jgi:threonyl-tRNA synthetase